MSRKLNDEISYKILKLLEENPEMSQRQLAGEMGVSVGKINYCMKALIQIGLVKMANFARSNNKAGYAYVLTPKGVSEKAQVTKRFLLNKINQYERLRREIAVLKSEIQAGHSDTKNQM